MFRIQDQEMLGKFPDGAIQKAKIAPVSFKDPKVEGTFTTAASRVTAHNYTQEKIKGLEMMIRYYKERSNALTVTCRIPQQILGAIFKEVVDRDELNMFDAHLQNKKLNLQWIRSISHICSHWRRAALSNPNLWSDIPIVNSPWAKEMIQRSKMSPLMIKYSGTLYSVRPHQLSPSACYEVLKDVLSSHISRIATLALVIKPFFIAEPGYDYPEEKRENEERLMELFVLLQQPAPMMKRLEMYLYPGAKVKIPNAIAMGSSPLQHLKLVYCNMPWEISVLENLRSLSLSHLPMNTRLMAQLLILLSQAPLLGSLELRMDHNSLQSPSDMTPIQLKQLEHIEISMSLRNCAVFFDHISFSRKPHTIKLRLTDSALDLQRLDKSLAISLMRGLAEKFERGVEGSVSKLALGQEIQCWKSTPGSQISDLTNKPTIEVSFNNASVISNNIKHVFWQSLCLDQLSLLDIKQYLEPDLWASFSDLPFLKSLCVCADERTTLSALERGIIAAPDVPTPRPSFVGLRRLTITGWYLDDGFDDTKTVAQRMIDCLRLRQQAGLKLDLLRLQDCRTTETEAILRLKECIQEVILDFSRGDFEETESDTADIPLGVQSDSEESSDSDF